MTNEELVKAILTISVLTPGFVEMSPRKRMRPNTFRMVLLQAAVLSCEERYFTRKQLGELAGCESDIAMRALEEWRDRGVCVIDSFRNMSRNGRHAYTVYNVRLDLKALAKQPRMVDLPPRYADHWRDPRGLTDTPTTPEIREVRDEILKVGRFDHETLCGKGRKSVDERQRLKRYMLRKYPGVCYGTIAASIGIGYQLIQSAIRLHHHRRHHPKVRAGAGGAA